MKRKIVIVLAILAVGFVLGAARTAKAHIMDVELCRPQRGTEGLQILNVTMFDKTVTKDQAAAMLKAQLESVVGVYKPTDDVMCTAWDEAGYKQLVPRDETPFYHAKAAKIMTYKEYQATQKK